MSNNTPDHFEVSPTRSLLGVVGILGSLAGLSALGHRSTSVEVPADIAVQARANTAQLDALFDHTAALLGSHYQAAPSQEESTNALHALATATVESKLQRPLDCSSSGVCTEARKADSHAISAPQPWNFTVTSPVGAETNTYCASLGTAIGNSLHVDANTFQPSIADLEESVRSGVEACLEMTSNGFFECFMTQERMQPTVHCAFPSDMPPIDLQSFLPSAEVPLTVSIDFPSSSIP